MRIVFAKYFWSNSSANILKGFCVSISCNVLKSFSVERIVRAIGIVIIITGIQGPGAGGKIKFRNFVPFGQTGRVTGRHRVRRRSPIAAVAVVNRAQDWRYVTGTPVFRCRVTVQEIFDIPPDPCPAVYGGRPTGTIRKPVHPRETSSTRPGFVPSAVDGTTSRAVPRSVRGRHRVVSIPKGPTRRRRRARHP